MLKIRLVEVALLIMLVVSPQRCGAVETNAPAQRGGERFHSAGRSLRKLFPELEKRFGVRLAAGSSLQDQRVTISGEPLGFEQSKRALKDLLSAGPEATVFWAKERDAEVWRLEESMSRKDLAARLRDQDQQNFRQYFGEQQRWARAEAPKQLANLEGLQRGGLIHRLIPIEVLGRLTEPEMSQFLDGEPLILSLGDLRKQGLGDLLSDWTVTRKVFQVDAPNSDLWRVVFMRERNPSDPQGGGVTISLIEPRGFIGTVQSVLRQPHSRPGSSPLTSLLNPNVPVDKDGGRQVTVNLTPAPGEPVGSRSPRTLDQVLEALSTQLRLTCIADGYLRPAFDLPTNMELKGFPLEVLLDRIASAWDCDWHYFENDQNCVIFRARHWWLEDAANVPQPLLAKLTGRLGAGRSPDLDDLVLLSSLSDAQVYRLVNETKLLPAAANVLPPGVYTGTGAKPCLQFYGQLPVELRKRARTAEGLSLADVDPALIMKYLHRTLAMWVGAVTPEQRHGLLFSIMDLGGEVPGAEKAGYRVWIRSAQRPGSQWQVDIRVPPGSPGRLGSTD